MLTRLILINIINKFPVINNSVKYSSTTVILPTIDFNYYKG